MRVVAGLTTTRDKSPTAYITANIAVTANLHVNVAYYIVLLIVSTDFWKKIIKLPVAT